jgi:arylsulfatase
MALRIKDVKLTFAVQRALTSNVWAEPLVKLRVPHIFHLRRDPFERADFNSQVYWKWLMQHAPYLYLAQAVVAQQVDDFVKYPPRQKAASFNLDTVMASLAPAEAAYKKAQAAAKQQPAPTK